MDSFELFYTPPLEEVFEEMKRLATEIWQSYDNTFGYVDDKLSRIEPLKNEGANFMVMFNMFDIFNQKKIVEKASLPLILSLKERIGEENSESFKFLFANP